MESISEDISKFTKGCECLLSALARHKEFSELERGLIDYYCQELVNHTQALRTEPGASVDILRREVKVELTTWPTSDKTLPAP